MLSVADKHGFHFDAVLHPINVMDAHFRSFGKLVYPELVKRNIGTLSMKPFGDTVILKSKTASPMECLQYALYVNKTGTVITGIDNQQVLDQAFEAVSTLGQVTPQQITAILGRTAKAAESGEYELFKTSAHLTARRFMPTGWRGSARREGAGAQRIARPIRPRSIGVRCHRGRGRGRRVPGRTAESRAPEARGGRP